MERKLNGPLALDREGKKAGRQANEKVMYEQRAFSYHQTCSIWKFFRNCKSVWSLAVFYLFALRSPSAIETKPASKHRCICLCWYDTRVDNGKYLNFVLTICHTTFSDSIHRRKNVRPAIGNLRIATMGAQPVNLLWTKPYTHAIQLNESRCIAIEWKIINNSIAFGGTLRKNAFEKCGIFVVPIENVKQQRYPIMFEYIAFN